MYRLLYHLTFIVFNITVSFQLFSRELLYTSKYIYHEVLMQWELNCAKLWVAATGLNLDGQSIFVIYTVKTNRKFQSHDY